MTIINYSTLERVINRDTKSIMESAFKRTYQRTPVRTGRGRASLGYDRRYTNCKVQNNLRVLSSGRTAGARVRETRNRHLYYTVEYVKYAHAKKGFYMRSITRAVKNSINNKNYTITLIYRKKGQQPIRFRRIFRLRDFLQVEYVFPYKDSPALKFTYTTYFRDALQVP